MKADGLFIIMCFVFLFVVWVATGGPSKPISTAGPYITPVTRSGEESQGYHLLVPTNPINTGSYPKQISGGKRATSTGTDFYYQRPTSAATSSRK